jgi:hypothetical protein
MMVPIMMNITNPRPMVGLLFLLCKGAPQLGHCCSFLFTSVLQFLHLILLLFFYLFFFVLLKSTFSCYGIALICSVLLIYQYENNRKGTLIRTLIKIKWQFLKIK